MSNHSLTFQDVLLYAWLADWSKKDRWRDSLPYLRLPIDGVVVIICPKVGGAMDQDEFSSYETGYDEGADVSPTFSPLKSRRARILSGGERSRSVHRRGTTRLPVQQLALLIIINAVLSLIISLIVVSIVGRRPPAQSEQVVSAATATAQPVAEAANPTTEPLQDRPTSAITDTPVPVLTVPGAAIETQAAPATPTQSEPVYHIVQPGDTLSSIAEQYDVDLQDLMRANGIDDPDYVLLGQELIVPVGGMPIVTATPTTVPAVTNTALPFEPPTPLPAGATIPAAPAATVLPTPTAVPTLTPVPAAEVQRSLEVLYPDDPVKETVYIVNSGLYVRLTGWTLSDENGNTYVFPDFGLGGSGAAISIHTGSGIDTATDLYWGRSATAWNVGEIATLKDSNGKIIVSQVVTQPAP
jgi:LysM repeat protein